MSINYKKILSKEDFYNKKISGDKEIIFNEISTKLNNKYKRNGYTSSLYNYKLDIIPSQAIGITKTKSHLFENYFEKIIFIINTIFDDNEKFVHYLDMVNINKENINDFIKEINRSKKIYILIKEEVPLTSIEKITKLQKITGIFNKELIINKILEIYYYHNELIFNENKIKIKKQG